MISSNKLAKTTVEENKMMSALKKLETKRERAGREGAKAVVVVEPTHPTQWPCNH